MTCPIKQDIGSRTDVSKLARRLMIEDSFGAVPRKSSAAFALANLMSLVLVKKHRLIIRRYPVYPDTVGGSDIQKTICYVK